MSVGWVWFRNWGREIETQDRMGWSETEYHTARMDMLRRYIILFNTPNMLIGVPPDEAGQDGMFLVIWRE